MSNTNKTLVTLIALLLLMCVGIGLLAYFTNGFDFSDTPGTTNSDDQTDPSDPDTPDDPQLPSVDDWLAALNGKELTTESVLPEDPALRIDINATEFTVEILPNASATFDFRHNGALVKFPYVDGSFNEAFGVEFGDRFFTVNTANRSMTEVLSGFYSGEDITDVTTLNDETAYFILRISADGKTLEIPLAGFYEFLKIELDKTEIVF